MHGRGVRDDVGDGLEPEREPGAGAGRLAAAAREERAHLAAVLVTERRGVQVQEGAVEPHHARPGAKPRARASFTSPASRRASARATSMPNGVIR